MKKEGGLATTAGSGLNVHSDSVSSGIAKLKYRLGAPRRWWLHSIARKVAQQICKFPLRILATRQLPNWGLFHLPQTPDGLPPNSFLQSCSEDIQALCKEYPWADYLDAEIAAKSFALGAAWAHNNGDRERNK
jgi:hypothetical protein